MYKIIYVVHSDVNENNVYAEFDNREEAIEYAIEHAYDQTYVVAVDAEMNDFGEVTEVNEEETIWNYADGLDENLVYDYMDDAATDMLFAEADKYEEEQELARMVNEVEYDANFGPDWYNAFDNQHSEENNPEKPVQEDVEICIHVDDEDALDIVEWPDVSEPRANFALNEPAEICFEPECETPEPVAEVSAVAEEPAVETPTETAEIVVAAEVPAEVANELKGDEEVKVEIPEAENAGESVPADIITADDTSEDDSKIEDIEVEIGDVEKDTNEDSVVEESKEVPVVNCPVNDVITHSEDEKPLDCEMKDKPLEKPLTEEHIEEDTHATEAKPEFDNIAEFNKALKIAKDNDADVIYGYQGSDKHGGYRYYAIEPIICKTDAELDSNTKLVMGKYHPSGAVLVAYKDKGFVESYEDDMTDEELAEELWKAHCNKHQ